MSENPASRRRFLSHVLLAAVAAPLAGAAASRAFAAPLPKLPVTNAQAKALHYVEDAGKATVPGLLRGQQGLVLGLGKEGLSWLSP